MGRGRIRQGAVKGRWVSREIPCRPYHIVQKAPFDNSRGRRKSWNCGGNPSHCARRRQALPADARLSRDAPPSAGLACSTREASFAPIPSLNLTRRTSSSSSSRPQRRPAPDRPALFPTICRRGRHRLPNGYGAGAGIGRPYPRRCPSPHPPSRGKITRRREKRLTGNFFSL